MITKAEIKEIDYNSNLCKVRIPIFEGPGNVEPAIFVAVMNVPPGVHSGYTVGDVVLVGFADNSMNKPVVLGKLWLGATQELLNGSETGYVSCANLEVEKAATFISPSSIQFESGKDYKDIQDIITKLEKAEARVKILESLLQAAILAVVNPILGAAALATAATNAGFLDKNNIPSDDE
jgi:hypothetical protein